MFLRVSLTTCLHYEKLHFKHYEASSRRQIISAHIALRLDISLVSLKVPPWLVVMERSSWDSSVASHTDRHYQEFAFGITSVIANCLLM